MEHSREGGSEVRMAVVQRVLEVVELALDSEDASIESTRRETRREAMTYVTYEFVGVYGPPG